jgi:hypothetical protein
LSKAWRLSGQIENALRNADFPAKPRGAWAARFALAFGRASLFGVGSGAVFQDAGPRCSLAVAARLKAFRFSSSVGLLSPLPANFGFFAALARLISCLILSREGSSTHP